ncbi:S8 family serine peptidase [Denitrobacterium detoxificans]|uniref:Serine protease, subtilisin family n=1 Tax=Denitrobacterium detoxificans TaxID=79604 RepID=A0A1H8S656_9ACTN|nr:S8 family serine peptidase [Denitrobacterium detoxificans]SEO74016.1 Serine protease, subtilisin family [Denitrobacterium detoxificans]
MRAFLSALCAVGLSLACVPASAFGVLGDYSAYADESSLGNVLSVQAAEDVTGVSAEAEGDAYVAGEVLVQFKNDIAEDDAESVVDAATSVQDADIASSDVVLGSIEDGVLTCDYTSGAVVVLPVADGVTVAQAIAELESDPRVLSAQPNWIFELPDDEVADTSDDESTAELLGLTAQSDAAVELEAQTTQVNDTLLSYQWALDAVNLPEAWDLARCDNSNESVADANVSVAVLDTGIHASHEDLQGNVVAQYDAATDTEGAITDVSSDSHGTHVAGIISGVANNGVGVAGASYNANIVAVKMFDDSGGNTSEYTFRAMNYVLDHAQEYDIRVVNISAGVKVFTDYDWSNDALCQCISAAREAGILTVCAAGNTGSGNIIAPCAEYPGDYDDCLSVINLTSSVLPPTSLTNETALANYLVKVSGAAYTKSSSSNYNETGVTRDSSNRTKDISAPGTRIWSTIQYDSADENPKPYNWLDGTSQASPLVAGIAALLFAECPSLSPDDAQEILEQSSTDLGDSGWDRLYGYGMIDACAALEMLDAYIPCFDVSLEYESTVYTGEACEPAVTVADVNGTVLQEGVDYTVLYADNVHAGTATVVVAGMGSYSGSQTLEFTIEKAEQPFTVSLASTQLNYGDAASPLEVRGVASDAMLAYASSDEAVVEVTEDGLVVPKAVGEATITVSYADDCDYVASAQSIEVAVSYAPSIMYRLYNPNSGEHFYTAVISERDDVVRAGWTYEGVGWIAAAVSPTPVYRLYNPNGGDHHYTMSAEERDWLRGLGWKYEGIGWYSADEDDVPVYRQYNPNATSGAHNFTTSASENDMLVRLGWRAEGIAWYALAEG